MVVPPALARIAKQDGQREVAPPLPCVVIEAHRYHCDGEAGKADKALSQMALACGCASRGIGQGGGHGQQAPVDRIIQGGIVVKQNGSRNSKQKQRPIP